MYWSCYLTSFTPYIVVMDWYNHLPGLNFQGQTSENRRILLLLLYLFSPSDFLATTLTTENILSCLRLREMFPGENNDMTLVFIIIAHILKKLNVIYSGKREKGEDITHFIFCNPFHYFPKRESCHEGQSPPPPPPPGATVVSLEVVQRRGARCTAARGGMPARSESSTGHLVPSWTDPKHWGSSVHELSQFSPLQFTHISRKKTFIIYIFLSIQQYCSKGQMSRGQGARYFHGGPNKP